ncbi:helix-turn-helix domain-containing protein [Olivibacter sp. XZL3]|uniref:AraC family transcriptional regulator n=1 Tax=Olivibacter sp. XZL3 TaxID=1735116 RepID=UPI001066BB7B|nr:helix-turn-helix domain-containing protein [Olivibacter sp. XZL3]
MSYTEVKPHPKLEGYIDAFWTVVGSEGAVRSQRIMPDGCVDLIFNLGEDCGAENGRLTMQRDKIYLVGTMTTFSDSFLTGGKKLIGVRFKPAAFSSFYNYAPMHELTNLCIGFERSLSPDIDLVKNYSIAYLQAFFLDRVRVPKHSLFNVINYIRLTNGNIGIDTLATANHITRRQLEREFRNHIGVSPKEYLKIIRFKNALKIIKENRNENNFSEIAFKCGFYDQAHFSNEIKRYAGLTPSQI